MEDVASVEPDLEASVAIRLDAQPAVHIDLHGQLIAAIKLVSSRNKDRADAKETYASRYLSYLRLGVHLMLVDVLPRPKCHSFSPIPRNHYADILPRSSPTAFRRGLWGA